MFCAAPAAGHPSRHRPHRRRRRRVRRAGRRIQPERLAERRRRPGRGRDPRGLGRRVRPGRRQPVPPPAGARHGGRPGHHRRPPDGDLPRPAGAQPPGPDAVARGPGRPARAPRTTGSSSTPSTPAARSRTPRPRSCGSRSTARPPRSPPTRCSSRSTRTVSSSPSTLPDAAGRASMRSFIDALSGLPDDALPTTRRRTSPTRCASTPASSSRTRRPTGCRSSGRSTTSRRPARAPATASASAARSSRARTSPRSCRCSRTPTSATPFRLGGADYSLTVRPLLPVRPAAELPGSVTEARLSGRRASLRVVGSRHVLSCICATIAAWSPSRPSCSSTRFRPDPGDRASPPRARAGGRPGRRGTRPPGLAPHRLRRAAPRGEGQGRSRTSPTSRPSGTTSTSGSSTAT